MDRRYYPWPQIRDLVASDDDWETLRASHGFPRITGLIPEVDLAIFLSLYRPPDDDPPWTWGYTPIGGRLHEAKYDRSTSGAARAEARLTLRSLLADYVAEHLLLRNVAVAALPSSDPNAPDANDLPEFLVEGLRQTHRIVQFERIAVPLKRQKELTDSDDPIANQRGTLRANFTNVTDLLIVDDLVESGGSFQEAARAAREVGVNRVFALGITKTWKGCRGLPREWVEPNHE